MPATTRSSSCRCVVVVVATCLRVTVGTEFARVPRVAAGLDPRADEDDRHRRCEQERGRSRIAAPVVAAHYQPEAAQTSRFSRDASAPAASRKSVPASLVRIDDRAGSRDEGARGAALEGAPEVGDRAALGTDAGQQEDRARHQAPRLGDGLRMRRADDRADGRQADVADHLLAPLVDERRDVVPHRPAVGEDRRPAGRRSRSRYGRGRRCRPRRAGPRRGTARSASRPSHGLTVSASARGGDPSRYASAYARAVEPMSPRLPSAITSSPARRA